MEKYTTITYPIYFGWWIIHDDLNDLYRRCIGDIDGWVRFKRWDDRATFNLKKANIHRAREATDEEIKIACMLNPKFAKLIEGKG